MRILYLSPWFPYPLDTGSRVRVYHLLQALAQRYEVTLLTLDPRGWASAQVDAVVPLCEHIAVVPRDPFRRGRLRTATRFLSLRPMVAAPFSEMTGLARRLHSERPFDIAVAATVVMATYALALPDIPHVLEEHNSQTRWMYDRYQAATLPLQRLRCWMSWRKSALYEARLFRRFDLITMVSEGDAAVSRRLLRNGDPPVVSLPNGVDCERFLPGLADPQPGRLIFGGSLSYRANYEAMHFFLREVYPRVRHCCPDVHLRITGSVQGVDLTRLPLDERVTLTGFVDDIRPEVASAWIAVVPILSGGGTRIKILEAMALGTPVVSTSKGAQGLDVTPGEDILIADTPEEFAQATLRLLQDPSLRARLATNARRLVEQRYDWAHTCQRFIELVEGIASRKKCRGACP